MTGNCAQLCQPPIGFCFLSVFSMGPDTDVWSSSSPWASSQEAQHWFGQNQAFADMSAKPFCFCLHLRKTLNSSRFNYPTVRDTGLTLQRQFLFLYMALWLIPTQACDRISCIKEAVRFNHTIKILKKRGYLWGKGTKVFDNCAMCVLKYLLFISGEVIMGEVTWPCGGKANEQLPAG